MTRAVRSEPAETEPGPREVQHPEPSSQTNERPDEELEAAVPPAGERLVEEELPPGFWEAAPEPRRSTSRQEEQVRAEPDRPPREETSAAGQTADPLTGHPPLSDPAFETLQALFPGRIISIDVEDQAPDEEAPLTGQEVDDDEDESELLRNENLGASEVD